MRIREGNNDDLLWVSKLLSDGVRDGHFGLNLSNIKLFLKAIINKEKINFVSLRGKIDVSENYEFKLLVADLDATPTSFIVLKIGHDGIELHLAATEKENRKKGCFKNLIKHVINNSHRKDRIFARCYKNSTYAINALEQMGFIAKGNGDPIELNYLQPEHPRETLRMFLNSLLKKISK